MYSYSIIKIYSSQLAPEQVMTKKIVEKWSAPNLFMLHDAIAHPDFSKLFIVVSRMPSSTIKNSITLTLQETETTNTINYSND